MQKVHARRTQKITLGSATECQVPLIQVLQCFKQAFFEAGGAEYVTVFVIAVHRGNVFLF